MLKQNLEADEDEHDAAHDGGRLFVARAKGMADRHAGDGEDKGCDAYKRYSGHDVNRERRKRDAYGQGVNRGGNGENQVFYQVNLLGILVVALALVLGKGLPQHLAADEGQKDKGDPMVDGPDDAHELTAERPSDHGHAGLKAAKEQAEHYGDFKVDLFHAETLSDGNGKGVHRKANGEQHELCESHSLAPSLRASPITRLLPHLYETRCYHMSSQRSPITV